jgi:hypothetical protein
MASLQKITALGAAAVLSVGLAASEARATTMWASSVDSFTPGSFSVVTPGRDDTNNALGEPDGKMLSLGFGGELIVSFGKLFKEPGRIVEITFVPPSTHVEIVKVFAGLNGIFTEIATISNLAAGLAGGAAFGFSGVFDQIKLVDVSPLNGGSTDGFDVDAISVAAVPLPAGGLLLIGALGGLALLRRRTAA